MLLGRVLRMSRWSIHSMTSLIVRVSRKTLLRRCSWGLHLFSLAMILQPETKSFATRDFTSVHSCAKLLLCSLWSEQKTGEFHLSNFVLAVLLTSDVSRSICTFFQLLRLFDDYLLLYLLLLFDKIFISSYLNECFFQTLLCMRANQSSFVF